MDMEGLDVYLLSPVPPFCLLETRAPPLRNDDFVMMILVDVSWARYILPDVMQIAQIPRNRPIEMNSLKFSSTLRQKNQSRWVPGVNMSWTDPISSWWVSYMPLRWRLYSAALDITICRLWRWIKVVVFGIFLTICFIPFMWPLVKSVSHEGALYHHGEFIYTDADAKKTCF